MNQSRATTRVWPIASRLCAAAGTTFFLAGLVSSPAFDVAHGQTQGRQFHVSPSGAAGNDGSAQRPLDLTTALSQNSPARPGDIIWLHAGTYRGAFKSYLTGTSAAPIIVRQYPGERATIDSGTTAFDALSVLGAHTWFWGFEITSSDTKRISAESGSWPGDLRRGYGAFTRAPGIKFINLIVHDNAGGLGLWSESVGSEAYGNIVYYNGWEAPDRAHGHGIYTQNASGLRLIAENILFHQFSHGIHAYGSGSASLDNITLEGNISFMNGSISRGGIYESGRDLLLGGYRVAANPVLSANATYGGMTNVGYSAGCANGRITNNYLSGPLALINCNPVMTGNVVWDANWPKYGSWPTQYPQNTFHTTRPTGTFVRVRPNKYETGRAHIAVYNWNGASVLPVDISAARLPAGAAYEIRDAQNYFGTPIAKGTYDGRPVNLVMSGLRTAPAVGNVPVAPAHTAPTFAAFVVVPAATPATPPPPGPAPTDPPAPPDPTNPPTSPQPAPPGTPGPTGPVTVKITSPVDNTLVLNQSTVTVAAEVNDPEGIVTKVEFYRDGTNVGTAWKKPYSMQWSHVTSGKYSVTARVYDSRGVIATSAPVTLRAAQPPTVRLTSPTAGTYYTPTSLTVTASVYDIDGPIARVEFYRGSTLIGQSATAPYSYTWASASVGTHTFTAKAIDNLGLASTSAPVSVTVAQR